jgi:hypothetical protein
VEPIWPLRPADLLTFVELTGFVRDWEDLRLDVEFDLLALQVAIMSQPKRGAVIQGTGGLRKMEFAPPRGLGGGGRRRGKRNACRVCYVYFEEYHTVLLVTAYAKGRKEDLSNVEKSSIKKAIERIRHSLSSRHLP